jgi:hypothetical protein
MRNAADVPELEDDAAAFGMHRVGHPPPRGDLLDGMNSRRIEVALGHRADLAGLGDDQAGGGALAVIVDGQRSRPAAVDGAVAGQGRHDDAIGQRNVADMEGIEQRRHAASLLEGKARAKNGRNAAAGSKSSRRRRGTS